MTTEALISLTIATVQGVGPYRISNPYERADDIVVWLRGSSNTDFERMVLDVDFTVTPTSSESTGDVFLKQSPATLFDGGDLVIARNTPIEQGYLSQSGPRDKGLEVQLDRTTRAIQDLAEKQRRVLTVPFTAQGDDIIVDAPEAGRALVARTDGKGWTNGPLTQTAEQSDAAVARAEAAANRSEGAADAAAINEIYEDDFAYLLEKASLPDGTIVEVSSDGRYGDRRVRLKVDSNAAGGETILSFLPSSADIENVDAKAELQKGFNSVTAFETSSQPARGIDAIWKLGPYSYREVAFGGDIQNLVGVNLAVLPSDSGKYDIRAFGAIPDTATDYSALLRLALIRAAGAPVLVSGGTYRVDTLGSVEITQSVNLEGDGVLDGNNAATAYLNIGSSIDLFSVKNLAFIRMRAGALASAATHLIRKVRIRETVVTEGQTGFDFDCNIKHARVRDAVFNDLVSGSDVNAVRFGNNDWSTNIQEDYAVSGCTFERLTKTTNSGECHCVLAYGQKIRIYDNDANTVQNTANGLGAEAFYTKQLSGSIHDNNVTDGGTGEAYINIKGNGQGSRRVKCYANHLIEINITATAGINISCDQVSVIFNETEGLQGYAIRAPRQFLLDVIIAHNKIHNNGSVPIMWEAYGKSLAIYSNMIEEMTGEYGGGLASVIYIHNENDGVGFDIEVMSIYSNQIRITANSAANNLTAIHVRPIGSQIHRRIDIYDNTTVINGDATNIRDVWIDNDGTMGVVNVRGAESPHVTQSLDIDSGANITTLNVDWAGAGTPEGQVFASPGSVWRRTDGAVGTSLYRKETACNLQTGWAA